MKALIQRVSRAAVLRQEHHRDETWQHTPRDHPPLWARTKSLDASRNAAAQQYAVVVSNPQHDVPVWQPGLSPLAIRA